MLSREDLPHYRYQDYKRWEGRWELIEGIPFAMTPSPGYTHQRTSQKLAAQLEEGLQACPGCEALFALDWIIADDTVVQPDNLVICHQPEGQFLTKAPALIFEILSPSTSTKDRETKFRLYEREGVKYYCILDPENRIAKIYRLHTGRYVKQADVSQESFEFDLDHCAFGLDFSAIWP